jgi:hypothetical protein
MDSEINHLAQDKINQEIDHLKFAHYKLNQYINKIFDFLDNPIIKILETPKIVPKFIINVKKAQIYLLKCIDHYINIQMYISIPNDESQNKSQKLESRNESQNKSQKLVLNPESIAKLNDIAENLLKSINFITQVYQLFFIIIQYSSFLGNDLNLNESNIQNIGEVLDKSLDQYIQELQELEKYQISNNRNSRGLTRIKKNQKSTANQSNPSTWSSSTSTRDFRDILGKVRNADQSLTRRLEILMKNPRNFTRNSSWGSSSAYQPTRTPNFQNPFHFVNNSERSAKMSRVNRTQRDTRNMSLNIPSVNMSLTDILSRRMNILQNSLRNSRPKNSSAASVKPQQISRILNNSGLQPNALQQSGNIFNPTIRPDTSPIYHQSNNNQSPKNRRNSRQNQNQNQNQNPLSNSNMSLTRMINQNRGQLFTRNMNLTQMQNPRQLSTSNMSLTQTYTPEQILQMQQDAAVALLSLGNSIGPTTTTLGSNSGRTNSIGNRSRNPNVKNSKNSL